MNNSNKNRMGERGNDGEHEASKHTVVPEDEKNDQTHSDCSLEVISKAEFKK